MSISNIRADGAYIHGTNGRKCVLEPDLTIDWAGANGLAAMLPVFNATSRYVDQGGGKRKGAMAAYLEVWHADIQAVLDLKEQVLCSSMLFPYDALHIDWTARIART